MSKSSREDAFGPKPPESSPRRKGRGLRDVGVYAALAAGTAFLIVGHRSVYASQKIGLSKSAGLEVRLDVPIGELTRAGFRVREGSLTERVLRRTRPPSTKENEPPSK